MSGLRVAEMIRKPADTRRLAASNPPSCRLDPHHLDLLVIDSVDPFVIVSPSVAKQQKVNAPVTMGHTRARDLLDVHAQGPARPQFVGEDEWPGRCEPGLAGARFDSTYSLKSTRLTKHRGFRQPGIEVTRTVVRFWSATTTSFRDGKFSCRWDPAFLPLQHV